MDETPVPPAENSKPARVRGRPFVKGVSANPGGRPKGVAEVQELARQHTQTAIDALVKIAESGKSESAQAMAAQALLDRGWGKPTQPVEHAGAGGGPIQHQTVEDARPPIDVFLAEFAATQKALRDDTKH